MNLTTLNDILRLLGFVWCAFSLKNIHRNYSEHRTGFWAISVGMRWKSILSKHFHGQDGLFIKIPMKLFSYALLLNNIQHRQWIFRTLWIEMPHSFWVTTMTTTDIAKIFTSLPYSGIVFCFESIFFSLHNLTLLAALSMRNYLQKKWQRYKIHGWFEAKEILRGLEMNHVHGVLCSQ